MKRYPIIGQEEPDTTPREIWMPGAPQGVPKQLILPDHLKEPEEADPNKALENLVLGANKDIASISQLSSALIAASMQPRAFISYSEKDPENPIKQIFTVSLGTAYPEELERIDKELARQLESQGVKKIPRLVQTTPEYVAVFFHPFEGHQIGIKRK